MYRRHHLTSAARQHHTTPLLSTSSDTSQKSRGGRRLWYGQQKKRRRRGFVCIYDGPQRAALCLPGWMAYRCFCLVVYWKNEWMVPGERSSSLLFNVRESRRRRRSLVPPSLNYNILGVAFKFKQNNHKSLRALFSPECMFNCYSTSSLVEGNSKTRALLMTTC